MNSIATKDPTYDRMMEKAISFLVHAFENTGHNPKPVILHSIRTGLYLYHQNYTQNVVAAAILHDIIEDTDVKMEEIEIEFGLEVARLVAANTFNTVILQRKERDLDMLNRCKNGGKWALLIKAADILDNSAYFQLNAEEELSRWLLRKMEYFLELSSVELADEPVWHSLNQRYQELTQSSGIVLRDDE
jgi:guanosine-3',5'-bis(diphosphate) 3'-pyrophosphohydrolase